MRRHDQRTTKQGRAQLRQDDAEEGAPRAMAQSQRGLFQRRVQAAQYGRDRKVDQRVVGQADDQDGTGIALDPGRQRDPAEAVDEGRNGQWRHQQDIPHASPGQRRALDQPRRSDADDGGQADAASDEQAGVSQQLTDAWTPREGDSLVPADGEDIADNEEQRDERHERDQSGQRQQQARAGPAGPAQACCQQ